MNKKEIYRGSGNIFSDIDISDSERTFARAQIMSRITDIIESLNLTQNEAAKILGLKQGRVSELMNGKLDKFSLDHLFTLLNLLGRDIEIVIKPRKRKSKQAGVRVVMTKKKSA
ncbi:MAG: helix-turn-helix transcriptional regulator [Bdellovibrionota bacterium]